MLDIKELVPSNEMAKSLLEKYDFDIKKCNRYIMDKYLESSDNPSQSEYWLNVGKDVEECYFTKKQTS